MAIEVKFRVKDDERLYDNPLDVVGRAAYLSQQKDGAPIAMERGVKYTRSQEFKWTSLGEITLPKPITETGAVAVDDETLSGRPSANSAEGLVGRIFRPPLKY